MSTEKKKEQQLLEDVAAQPAVQSSYSTAGLNTRKEVENALTNAVYTPGQSVTDAAADLRNWQQNRPGKYESAYQGRIEDLIGQLLERNSFQYSYAQDPLYRQYAQQYTQNARNASADAAAQAAALTGGYGSSYAASVAQQTFNNVLSILGVIGDAVQLAITGTTGIGSLVGTLANTGYNMYAKDRAYAAERADAAWDQQMQETQRQDSLAQQKYKNEQAERQYQDTLRQQEFNNNVTSEKLNIAKGEWALKQSKAAQSAQQAAANAGAKSAGSSGGSGSGSVLSSGGSTIVPYSAARLYRQGRSDTAIRSELLKEGYSNDEVANILKQLGS